MFLKCFSFRRRVFIKDTSCLSYGKTAWLQWIIILSQNEKSSILFSVLGWNKTFRISQWTSQLLIGIELGTSHFALVSNQAANLRRMTINVNQCLNLVQIWGLCSKDSCGNLSISTSGSLELLIWVKKSCFIFHPFAQGHSERLRASRQDLQVILIVAYVALNQPNKHGFAHRKKRIQIIQRWHIENAMRHLPKQFCSLAGLYMPFSSSAMPIPCTATLKFDHLYS